MSTNFGIELQKESPGQGPVSGTAALEFCGRLWCLATGQSFEGPRTLDSAAFRDFLALKGLDTPEITPLFDNRHYAQQIAWAANSTNLILHYCLFASAGGLRPHAMFDPDHVLSQAGLECWDEPPLLYFLSHQNDGLSPHPLFDIDLYRASVGDAFLAGQTPVDAFLQRWTERPAAFSPYFSWRYYALHEPGVGAGGINPLLHFLSTPLEYRRDPNPLFQRAWYASEIVSTGDMPVEPLVHYVTIGLPQGLMPNPFAAAELGALSVGRAATAALLKAYIDTTEIDGRASIDPP